MRALRLHDDRLFPANDAIRSVARELYGAIKAMPIISPHGHTDPAWFADDIPFPNATDLMITPDHYVFRMLYSQGVSLESLGLRPAGNEAGDEPVESDPREAWRRFAAHYHLFLGTPSRMWHDWVYSEVFGLESVLSEETADLYYDTITDALARPELRPRAILDRFDIELIATTEGALDPLMHHHKINEDGWGKRVITTFRPDSVIDPDTPGFAANLDQLGEMTGCDTNIYQGYIDALRDRRSFFKATGATATDHGHPSAATFVLERADAEALYRKVHSGTFTPQEAEIFRGHMLSEMARMSLDDGLVMQLHPGSRRNHNEPLWRRFGANMGADIPLQTDYVTALKPLLNAYGNDPRLTLIMFTLDETSYSRELAPLAGHYPALKLGPPWWFHDSPEGMRRFREQVTETAGFYNTAGFNDDTRALLSIPARHDVARRMDAAFLARLVVEHRLDEADAHSLMEDLTYNLAKQSYRLS